MNKITSKNITRLFLSILVLASCQPKTDKQVNLQEELANVLNIQGIPQTQFELEPFGFSDMGAWHGYTLPSNDSTAYYGGFSGPLCMKMWGQWVSKNLSQLELTDASSMTTIDLSKATAEVNYKPGKLEQTLELEQTLVVGQDLWILIPETIVILKLKTKPRIGLLYS